VNRDLSRDITARIDIAGFSSGPLGAVRTLTASSIYETNDEVEPEHIHTRESSVSISMRGFQYTFPHEAITLIELTRR
jgi:alpha-L-arabinofuranosidase